MIAAAVLAISCEDSADSTNYWPWNDPETDVPGDDNEPEQTPVEDASLDKWSDVTSDFGTLPE